MKKNSPAGAVNGPGSEPAKSSTQSVISRRKFVGLTASSVLAATIVPRHILGGKGYIAPSDKITLAYIGIGTQGIRELLELLPNPQFQVVAVCDPNKDAVGYRDWSPNGIKSQIRKVTNQPDWNPGGDNTIPGGRDNGKSIVETFYANLHPELHYKGCASYADFRELFDREKDLDAVKIMTPDHLHGLIAMAALKRGKHILLHKPLSNRLLEGKQVIETARSAKSITHLIPWDSNGSMEPVMKWIQAGAIGKLTEVHNWTNRPVWPQYATLPTDTPPVPAGLDWNIWLGPEAERPYHPNYTNMVFRGWYDFGGGSMADMGHYSLWAVFNALELESPTLIEPNLSHVCAMHDNIPYQIRNDFSFPMASSVRFKYPAKGSRPAIDLVWYDGGMRPPVPEELLDANKELPAEGMMFVGDRGKILAGFNIQNPQLISGTKMDTPGNPNTGQESQGEKKTSPLDLFASAVKTGKPYPGSFPEAEYLTEAINLYAVALRSGRMLKYDSQARQITNVPDANKYLGRTYRTGWDIAAI